jgi:DNA-binding NarL/FixJ family response regulator
MKQLPVHRPRAFIVEDSPVILENLIAALQELTSIEVVASADNEAGAHAWLAEHGQDCELVIVDLFLKSGSGMSLLRRLKDEDHPYRRLVLSNYATPDVRRKCLDLGADRVFDKSGEIDALVDYCIELADSYRGQ